MATDISLITVYHSGSSRALLRESLSSTVPQVVGRGRVLLVANGVEDQDPAPRPDSIVSDLDPALRDFIVAVPLPTNLGGAGGLNAGVDAALSHAPSPDAWVGQVQSSVVPDGNWVDQVLAAASANVGGIFGTMFIHRSPQHAPKLWTRGHTIVRACVRLNTRSEGSTQTLERLFPCLSACCFRASLVREVVEKYGEFVFPALPHYGDCADAALRLASVGAKFRYAPSVIAWKRQPEEKQMVRCCTNLVATGLYYPGRFEETEREQARRVPAPVLDGALLMARQILARPYSTTNAVRPLPTLEADPAWRGTT